MRLVDTKWVGEGEWQTEKSDRERALVPHGHGQLHAITQHTAFLDNRAKKKQKR